MTTDPGDLVLDPTCGSGTTAYVAEQWGRRWITCDTSRVALALARTRLMAARYPYYYLADSEDGSKKQMEVTGKLPLAEVKPTGDLRKGFVYKTVPHVTLKAIANNSEIDDIHARWQEKLEPVRAELNALLKQQWQEWEIPREAGGEVAREGRGTAGAMVGMPPPAPAGDRRLHRPQRRHRDALRSALRGQEAGAGGRPVHRGKPVPASGAVHR